MARKKAAPKRLRVFGRTGGFMRKGIRVWICTGEISASRRLAGVRIREFK